MGFRASETSCETPFPTKWLLKIRASGISGHAYRFAQDVRGTGVERWAVMAGVVGLLCVVGTHLLDAGLRNGAVPTILVQRGPSPATILAGLPTPSQTSVTQSVAGVDYTATTSIPSIAAGTRLDPCTGQPKP